MKKQQQRDSNSLTERLETSVDKELAAWVLDRAKREERKPAAILRRALRVYRDLEEAKEAA